MRLDGLGYIDFKMLTFPGRHGFFVRVWGRKLFIESESEMGVDTGYKDVIYVSTLKNWGEKYRFEPITEEQRKEIVSYLAAIPGLMVVGK